MVELLYIPDDNRAEVVDLGGMQDFEAYLSMLATGLENSAHTEQIVHGAIMGELGYIPYASELLSYENTSNIHDRIITSMRNGQISVLNGIADLKLLDRYETLRVFDKNGLIFYVPEMKVYAEPAENYFASDSVEGKLVREFGLTGVGMQIEYDPTANAVQHTDSDRGLHTSLGHLEDWLGENEQYTPVVTVLNTEHPVRQLIRDRREASE